MSTIRVAKRTRFTTVDRRTIRDERLSFRARGVLVWLLDKPDDWSARSDAIAAAGTEGRDAVRAALRELEALSYIVRNKYRNPVGQWEQEVIVYERPQEPGTDSQAPVIQASENQAPDSQALQEPTDTDELQEPPKPPVVVEEWKPTETDIEAGERTLRAMRARLGLSVRDESEVA